MSEMKLDLNKLNPEQRKAVETTEGALLVLAGAGSGKTRVLTHRIAHIIEKTGTYPSSILALTFTNKAAAEMRERVGRLIGEEEAQSMWVLTFHSCCVRILRRDIETLGYSSRFVIYDDTDQMALMRQVIKELGLNDKVYPPRSLLSSISDAKNHSFEPAKYLRDSYAPQQVIDAYLLYEKNLAKNNALDFDDLLLKTLTLFEKNPDVLAYYQERFRYILVDEYQDTNLAQYHIVRMLAAKHGNLCVVGDDDQSIYSWRGADIRNILEFEKDFPGAVTIRLEQNYRSTEAILNAANIVIKNNKGRKPKTLWTAKKGGEPVSLHEAQDERDEAVYIANTILNGARHGNGRSYSDYAVLYRTNSQSRVLEMYFKSYGIPYHVFGGLSFFARAEIKDILCYLRLLANPNDNIAFMRVINVPKRGLGDSATALLEQYAGANNLSLFAAAMTCPDIPSRYRAKVSAFVDVFVRASEDLSSEPLVTVVENMLAAIGYDEYLRAEKKDSYEISAEIVRELINYIADFEKDVSDPETDKLEAFLENVALFSSSDESAEESASGKVSMMTLHSAKGLEFPVVFLCGMEEGLFPSSQSRDDPDRMEEERRLCYVGITRAMQELHLSYARQRMIYGRIEESLPSQFLDELSSVLPDAAQTGAASRRTASAPSRWDGSSYSRGSGFAPDRMRGSSGSAGAKTAVRNGTQSAASSSAAARPAPVKPVAPPKPTTEGKSFTVGQRVKHNIFGAGTIVAIQNQIIEIDFDKGPSKKLALGYAPITPLSE